MELANPNAAGVRLAQTSDSQALLRLLRSTYRIHVHADWRQPVDWLGADTFVVQAGSNGRLQACLAVIADPPPAAWVRVAAVSSEVAAPSALLAALWSSVAATLRRQGIREVGWLAANPWLDELAPELGFQAVTAIETYHKPDLVVPTQPTANCLVRPLRLGDLPGLVALEAAAFDPLWRHSLEGLRRGWEESFSFDVAEVGKELAGFQYSVAMSDDEAHLVRLTVNPVLQGQGIGGALLAHAIDGYRLAGLHSVSLNTQVDNLPSQRLYRRFGFEATGQRFPVWVARLSGD